MFGKWFHTKQEPEEEMTPPEPTATEPAVPESVALLPGRLSVFTTPSAGASSLYQSLEFLRGVVQNRLAYHFGKIPKFEQPDFTLPHDGSSFATFVVDRKLTVEEFVLLLLSLAPHAHPDLFSDLIVGYLPNGGDLSEFGGIKGINRGVCPTGETALFVLADMDIDRRLQVQQLLADSHFFAKERIVTLETVAEGDVEMSGRLMLSREYVELFLMGQTWRPRFSGNFPAKLLTTSMTWADLVLADPTRRDLEQLRYWLNYGERLRQDSQLGSKLKPGYRALFYGPPGTGKTLTASLLGKEFGKDVYRIDLSLVVSKYIGETQKNLQAVFEVAQTKDWILFFDEADALFSKRTSVGTANDRYANQEIGYLLQQLEEYPKLIILATNFKNNLDSAFIRRFQSVIQFIVPDVAERKLLWQKTLPASITYADLNIDELASRYELSGAAILNCVQMSSLRALATDPDKPVISKVFLIDEIRKEYQKEGKTF